MPRGKELSEAEKAMIDAFRIEGRGYGYIAKQISRSKSAIADYVTKRRNYGAKKRPGRPSKLSPRDKRTILRKASNSAMSLVKIRDESKLNVSKTTIYRTIVSSPHIVRSKMMSAPRLKNTDKSARLSFAKVNMSMDWENVVFSDEKKFNLDGPDGFNSYWHDIRKDVKYFSKRNFGGGSVMIWACFSARGKNSIAFISHKMNSTNYTNMLDNYLIPFWTEHHNENLIFMQDNASIHKSTHALRWFCDNNIPLLDWPARSPDINPIENLWGILVRRIFSDNRTYSNVNELKHAIVETWNNIEENIVKNLISSMPNRIFDIIRGGGNTINY
ncbi:Transposable element Tc3 transposase [Anthophora retusa]